MNEQITGLASLGRYEDNRIAHVADGEMIVPPLAISLATKRQIFRDMLNQGINPANYIVGSSMGINPATGLPEFFLKKLVKAVVKPVKKIVKSKLFKKIAPLAGVIAAPFTGGLSAALIGGIGGLASGKGLKGGILGALGGFGASSALGAIKGAGGLGSALKGLGSKISSKFGGIKSLFGGKGGLGSILGGGSGTGGITSLIGSSQNPLMTLARSAISGDSNPLKTLALNRMGRSSNPLLRMVSDAYGQQVSDPNDPDAINREYDIYNQNLMKQFYDQQMKNAAALAVPAGALSYYSARKEADNPLQDVRDTIRPDLKMADVYGQGGFDLGFRGYSEGGEVDDVVDNFLSQSKFGGNEISTFVKGNPRFTELLRSLILAPTLNDMLSPDEKTAMAEAYDRDLREANKLGLIQLASGYDYLPARKLYNNPFRQKGYAEGGEVLNNLKKQRQPGSLSAAARYMKNPAQSTIAAAARGAFPIASIAARFNPYGAAIGGAISLYSLYKMSQDPEQVGALAAKYQKGFEETMAEAQELFNDGTQPIKEFVDRVRQGYRMEKEKEMIGYAEGGEVLDMRFGGESIGPGTGTSDDIPAMLSDGEFVMTASANNGIGGYKITKEKDSLTLIPSGKPNRKKGAQNMMNLMKTFEKYNEGKA